MTRRTTRHGEPLVYRCEVCGLLHELETGCEFEDDGNDIDVDAIVAAFRAVDDLPPEQREAAFNRAFNAAFGEDAAEPDEAPRYESEEHRANMEALRVLAGYVRTH